MGRGDLPQRSLMEVVRQSQCEATLPQLILADDRSGWLCFVLEEGGTGTSEDK
jgi:hypothetical protein